MGAALWCRDLDPRQGNIAEDHAGPPRAPVMTCRYRIEVLGIPRTPWRSSSAAAMQDAIDLGLTSWDAAGREHFLAVPVDMRVEHRGRGAVRCVR